MAFSSPLAPQPPTTFTYAGQTTAGGPIIGGVLIGDFVDDSAATPSGSAYNEPSVTDVAGVPVSAILELQSTTGTLLIMRMTTTQRNALVTVVDGMMIYNTTTTTFQFYQNGGWVSLSAGAGGVVGPGGGSTDNAVARWDGAGGTALKDSVVIIGDTGAVTGVLSIANAGGLIATPSYTFTGDLDTGMWHSAANTLDFSTNAFRALQLVASPALSVNYLTVTASATGNPLLLGAAGSDTDISVNVVTKGTGGFNVVTGNITALAGNVIAGTSGAAGFVASFPSASSKGSLRLTAVANTGDTLTTISNVAMGQASVVSIPDPASATARFLVAATATPFTTGNLIKASGTGGLTVDAGFSLKAATTAAYAGGGTSNAFTANGLTATSIVTAVILASTNSVSITKAVPGTNTLTVTFSADPGADTTVSWIGISAAV